MVGKHASQRVSSATSVVHRASVPFASFNFEIQQSGAFDGASKTQSSSGDKMSQPLLKCLKFKKGGGVRNGNPENLSDLCPELDIK